LQITAVLLKGNAKILPMNMGW